MFFLNLCFTFWHWNIIKNET